MLQPTSVICRDAENVEERKNYSRLLQIYSPVRLNGTDKIIAVAELYQKVDTLQTDINHAQWHTWLAVGLAMLLIYLALVAFVRWTSNTIKRQETELDPQVKRLSELLTQNGELRERVQRAAANASAVNEHFLRRISAELHDGPVQELGAALLRMDRVIGQDQTFNVPTGHILPGTIACHPDLHAECHPGSAGVGKRPWPSTIGWV